MLILMGTLVFIGYWARVTPLKLLNWYARTHDQSAFACSSIIRTNPAPNRPARDVCAEDRRMRFRRRCGQSCQEIGA
jgi:hypothetical protein